ncbi:DUF1826 domain-containing protein [Glaciecola sp. SC05]|uniref:DUF1826 domain-containing protein n=1 Tax=Glaciecola sp. SC05 TaxID=1987355 RepID=UPI0035286A59
MNAIVSTNLVDNSAAKFRDASISSDPHILTDIYNEHCNIAIWERDLPSDFIRQVSDDISRKPMMNVVRQVGANSIVEDIANIAADRVYAKQLQMYMAEVIDMFCVLFDTDKVGLRLSVLEKAMCPRFHFDRVPCRLVTTFCGIGTQWLPHNKINIHKLGHASGGKQDEESGLMHDATDIQNIGCGHVALLKGDTWEGNEGAGLVHRSPALKAGERRLLMTLDFVA